MGNNDCDEGSAQKPAQPSEFHPQAEATPGYWGGGGAQGFPSPELVLTARCQGEIPTDALSVRAMGVQPTQSQRTVVSAANIDSINLGSHKMITFSLGPRGPLRIPLMSVPSHPLTHPVRKLFFSAITHSGLK